MQVPESSRIVRAVPGCRLSPSDVEQSSSAEPGTVPSTEPVVLSSSRVSPWRAASLPSCHFNRAVGLSPVTTPDRCAGHRVCLGLVRVSGST
jgi:hypothetical protein